MDAVNLDDDAAGFVIAPMSGLTTTEAGGTATFSIVLASRPTADVTIALASSDATEGAVSSPSLTFTPADWDVPQLVRICSAEDEEFGNGVRFFLIAGVSVSAVEMDNDQPSSGG